jgi:RHH-type transcriptional regulator, rel operon repressor / antitoxin RelB
MAETTMTVRLDAEVKASLERLARRAGRPASRLAGEALADYVALDAWQVERIGEAVAKADAGGPFVPHEEAMRRLDRLAREGTPAQRDEEESPTGAAR